MQIGLKTPMKSALVSAKRKMKMNYDAILEVGLSVLLEMPADVRWAALSAEEGHVWEAVMEQLKRKRR